MKRISVNPVMSLLLLWVLLLFTNNKVSAQDFINEDFLDNIEGNARPLLAETNPAFSVSVVPDKWKKESATVIGFKRSILFDRKTEGGFFTGRERSLIFYEKVRFRIKLNDNSSVNTFSQMYFRYNDREDGFIARIIKPAGEILQVDLKDAVSVDPNSDIPEFFKSFFDQVSRNQRRYYKVAIPNLDPGDILEYVANTRSKLNVTRAGYIEFNPQYEICSKNFPVMYNEIVIETDEKAFFKSLSVNGAPEFRKEESEDKKFSRYVFTDRDRGTEKDVNFVKEMLVYPMVKFQVIYSSSPQARGALIGEQGELKKGFSQEELAKKAWEDYENTGSSILYSEGILIYTLQNLVNDSWAELKKLGAKDWSEKDYIRNCYYYVRNKVLFQSSYLSDKDFAYYFGALLFQRDIQSDLIISISNRVGALKDILFESEIRYLIRVKGQYYFNCTDHSNPGELVESLMGNEAYLLTKPPKRGNPGISPEKLPDSDFKDNTASFAVNVSLSSDMNKLQITRINHYLGINKARVISDAMKYTPYMLDDYKLFGGQNPMDNMRTTKKQEEYERSVKALKEEYKKAKPDFVKNELESEYRQSVTYKNFKITSDGRSFKKPELVYTEEFELSGFIRKAGKKYLINLTGLVGPQLQIKNEERDRKLDISVGYGRTLNWNIRFPIPDGYTVEGLAELNTEVENETGRFSTSAREENGVVIIDIQKIYKQANFSKSHWNEMLAFIDAAYNNSFKYILLKPKS